VHPDDLVEAGRGLLHQRRGAPDTGVVDQHVDAAERGRRGVDHRAPASLVADVVRREGRRRPELIGERLALGLADVRHDDVRAFRGEPARDGVAHAEGGAGHDRDLALEFRALKLPCSHCGPPRYSTTPAGVTCTTSSSSKPPLATLRGMSSAKKMPRTRDVGARNAPISAISATPQTIFRTSHGMLASPTWSRNSQPCGDGRPPRGWRSGSVAAWFAEFGSIRVSGGDSGLQARKESGGMRSMPE